MKNLLEVTTDKRTELIGVILLLSDYSKKHSHLISECNNKAYRDKIFNYFDKFKEDKTIKLFNEIINTLNFCYDAPMSLICQLNEKYEYNELDDYPFRERLNSSKLITDFLDSIPEFVEKTRFDDFYNKNKGTYLCSIKKVSKLIQDYDVIGFLRKLYKIDFNDVNFFVNLMHFATYGNYATWHKNNIYCHICLHENEKRKMDFIGEDVFGFLSLIVHEFSHSVINPLTDKYFNLQDNIFNDIMEQMESQAYDNNKVILDEHIIRAIQYIYLESVIKNDDSLYDRIVQYEKDRGFKYIEVCINSIKNYLNNINKFKNFEEYFPNILKDIEKYNEQLNHIKN